MSWHLEERKLLSETASLRHTAGQRWTSADRTSGGRRKKQPLCLSERSGLLGRLGLLLRAELGGREQAVRSSSDIPSSASGSSPPLPTLGPLKLHVLVPCRRVKDPTTWKAA